MSEQAETTSRSSRSLFDRHTIFIALFAAITGVVAANSSSIASVAESLFPSHQSSDLIDLALSIETVQDSTPVLLVRNPTDQVLRAHHSLISAAAAITEPVADRFPQATTIEVWFRDDVSGVDHDEPFPGLRRYIAMTGHRQVDGSIEFLDWERTVYSVPLSDSHPAARVVLAQFIPELLDRGPRTASDREPFQNRVKPILFRGNPREVRSLFGAPDIAALAASAEFLRRVPEVKHLRIKVPLVTSSADPENVMFECHRNETGFDVVRSMPRRAEVSAVTPLCE